MLTIRRLIVTLCVVITSFVVANAQEDKASNTETSAPALGSASRGESVTESVAFVSPAAGTGTLNFIPKWLETGGQGGLGDSVIFDEGGAVGIGTTTPGAKLDVVGNINTTTQYGIGGKRVLSVAGSFNTFVGVLAGEAPTTTGTNNSFFGAQAGMVNDTGSYNAFAGALAGRSNTSGNLNAFFGFIAGELNSSGRHNSFFGAGAGNKNTTGQSNSFFGTQAGTQTTTGNFNAFFGVDAGKVNTAGQDNTFAGAFAGDFNTTGGDNSFFGTAAGRSNSTGRSNTLIGHLTNVQVGNLSFATAIGSQAIVTTSNSVVLGRPGGEDTVRIPGRLTLTMLGTAGSTSLCRNSSNQIATCSSSLRHKRDVTPFGGGLNLVRQLRPVIFRWKTDDTLDVGFGAEDVARIAPLFVTHDSQGEIEGVKYGQLSAVLVSAVQEQQTQIAAQQDQLKRQQSQIDSMKQLVCLAFPEAEACK